MSDGVRPHGLRKGSSPASLSAAARDRARRRPDNLRPALPTPLRVGAAWGWRFLVLVAVVCVLGLIVWYLASLVVPVAIAILLAALLSPAVGWLQRHRIPRGAATAAVMVGGLALLGGVLTFVVITVVAGLPELGASSRPPSTPSSPGSAEPGRCA